MEKIKLRLLWHIQPQFAGAVMSQHSGIAARHGIDLNCQPIRFKEGPIDAVISGSADLCVASPSHMLESKNVESLVFLGTFQQTSPVIHVARKDCGIKSIADLAQSRIGVWPGNEDLELKWMLSKVGLDLDEIEFVPTGDPVDLLLHKEVSSAQMTTFNEYIQFLEREGNLDSVLCLSASDYEAELIKDGLVTTKNWIDENPDRAQNVVNSLLEGWTYALNHPEEAVGLCAKLRPDVEQRLFHEQFNEVQKLIFTGPTLTEGLGNPHLMHMQRAIESVFDVYGREVKKSAEHYVSDIFWQNAPSQFRRTDWSQDNC